MTSVDRISDLQGLWPYDASMPFSEWVMSVSGRYYSSSLPLEAASRLLGCTVAELQGVLRLSYLDPELLERLDDKPPPATTWFLFAEAQSEAELAAGLAALSEVDTGESAFNAVLAAMAQLGSPSAHGQVLALPSGCFWHLAHKAKVYDVLTKQARSFLAQVAKQKGQAERAGKPLALTRKQLDWLVSILWELTEKNVVRANSPDGDQAQCDAVLAALGKEDGHGSP